MVVCSRGGGSKSYRVVEGAVRRVNQWLNIRERIARRRADNASVEDNSGQGGGGARREGRRRKIMLRVKTNGRKELRVGGEEAGRIVRGCGGWIVAHLASQRGLARCRR